MKTNPFEVLDCQRLSSVYNRELPSCVFIVGTNLEQIQKERSEEHKHIITNCLSSAITYYIDKNILKMSDLGTEDMKAIREGVDEVIEKVERDMDDRLYMEYQLNV